MELLIVGAGAMGRWFARAMDSSVSVAFTDANEAIAQEAAEALDVRSVPLEADDQFDAICFAVPMSAIEESIDEHAQRARSAVFDVSGVMAAPLEAMATHAADLERVSMHPLFGPENAPGNVAVVVDSAGSISDRLLERLVADGNTLIETTAEEHDRAMETIQAKAHAAILAYAIASDDVPEGFSTPVSSGLESLVEQVTSGNPRVYAEIQDIFDGSDEIVEAARQIAAADEATFERLYREAGTGR